MVTDQGPGIQAEARVGQAQIISGLVRHGFQAPAKVVGQVTQQPADKRQLVFVRQGRRAEAVQALAQAGEEVVGRFVGARRQLCQWPGAENVVASAFGPGSPAVEQHGAGGMAQAGKVGTRVGAVRQWVYGAYRHAG